MTALDLIPDEELAREPVKEPPKRWRNWYKAHSNYTTKAGDVCGPGHVYHGSRVWPSKDAAETAAHKPDTSVSLGLSQYLGAYPDGEEP